MVQEIQNQWERLGKKSFQDENKDPRNIDVLQEDDIFRILCSSGAYGGRVMLYELRKIIIKLVKIIK